MAILNISADQIGQAGLSPKLIYINTNDLLSTITTPGYLSGQQVNTFSDSDMALVSYVTPGPIVVTQVALFDLDFANDLWVLNIYPAGGGSSGWGFAGDTVVGGLLGTNNGAGFDVITAGIPAISLDMLQQVFFPAVGVAPPGAKIAMIDPTTKQLYISP